MTDEEWLGGTTSQRRDPLAKRKAIAEGAREGVERDSGGASCYYTFHPLPRTGASVWVRKMPGQVGQDERLDVRGNQTRQECLTAVERRRLQMLRVFHVER